VDYGLCLDAGNGEAEVMGKPVLWVSIEFDVWKSLLDFDGFL